MPISAVLYLIPSQDVILRPTMGHHAHAAFLSLLRTSNPKKADEVHAASTQKPFTVSPLIGNGERYGNFLRVRADAKCWLRFTFLDDELFTHFSNTFFAQELPSIRLGQATFQFNCLVTSNTENHNWSGNTTYADLVQSAKPATNIHLRFHSPTAFRALTPRGQKSYNHTQVDPVRCYQSWINKWNAFAPLQFDKDELLTFITERSRISHAETRTQALNFGRHTEIGSVGTCTFRFEQESPLDENLLRAANCLANYAFYCGTGYKTTMGMGQTKNVGIRRYEAKD